MSEVRARLRQATGPVHERMHGHAGFAAAASGTITPADYRDLLARLYGFHAAFDAEMARAPAALAREIDLPARARADLLAEDLRGLGVAAPPSRRAEAPAPQDPAECLGALYVVEGSTLGGAVIARALAPAFGENRRFFLGHGGEHGRFWRGFVARLEQLGGDEVGAAERTAISTFDAFERWMEDWRGAAGPAKA